MTNKHDVAGEPESAVGTLVVQLGYRGANFSGFAKQPGQRTVAGELERALTTFFRRPVELTCAGRTDAGVHALSQYVSLAVCKDDLEISERRLLTGLGALTPDDMSVVSAYRAPLGFSARFDACSRTYRYRIAEGISRPVLSWDYSWWLRDTLDVDSMERAGASLVGEHDFKSFCKASSAQDKPTCRNVMNLHVRRVCEAGESHVIVDIQANAFLHTMVRTIVGTLVEVGRGKRGESWVKDVLAAKNRAAAGSCAPAKGLVFVGVEYPSGVLVPWEIGRLKEWQLR